MRASVGWVLLATTCSVLAAVPISSVGQKTKLSNIIPNKFIIELEPAALNSLSKRSPHDALYDALKARGVQFDVKKEFDAPGLFVGASLTLNNEVDVATLLQIQGIKNIRPSVRFSAPIPADVRIVANADDPALSIDTPHYLTNVDKVRANGNLGKGIKIGIIDTGVDFNHPALGNGKWGPGQKVLGGYDFVGDDYTGEDDSILMPDDIPNDCNGHGTHVAGIAAATRTELFNFTGAAPEASLHAYRVFGCGGGTPDEVIIDALLLGARDGNDILSLSLGESDGWTESSTSVIAGRIAESGIVMIVAAGNEGSTGSWFTSSPANGVGVISVASLDNTVLLSQPAIVHGAEHDPILYFSALKFPITEELPIYALSTDITIPDDACEPLPDSTPDLSKHLVLVRRGACALTMKIQNLADKGAKAVFIYNNGGSLTSFNSDVLPSGFIRGEDGEWLVQQFAAGNPVTISFPQEGGPTIVPNPSGGLISSFSTYGPTNDMYFKPTVAAPGGSILSTYPVQQGSWAILSGTSMATPCVAGAVALYLAEKGKSLAIARGVREVLQATSQRVLSAHAEDAPYQTLTQQGAGLIDMYKAINTNTVVTPTELLLNDTAHFNGEHILTITNTGKKSQSYELTHVAAGTALTFREDSYFPSTGPVPLTKASANVIIQPSSFSLPPGESSEVKVHITLPSDNDARFPAFTGWIQVDSQDDSVHATYLGVGNSLKNAKIIDNTDEFFGFPLPAIVDTAGEPQSDARNYTFVDGDFPTFLFRLAFGSRSVRLELVDAAASESESVNQRRAAPPFISFPESESNSVASFADAGPAGTLMGMQWTPRNDEAGVNPYNSLALETATFADGTAIPNGTYRLLLRALKVTGDPVNEADYETWLSPIVGIDIKH